MHKRQQHTTVIHYINAIIIYSDCTFSAEEGPGTDNSLLHLFWIVPTSTGTHANAVHLTGVRPLQASQPETSESLRSRCTGPIGPIRNPCLASTNFSLQLELFTLHLASARHRHNYHTESMWMQHSFIEHSNIWCVCFTETAVYFPILYACTY